MVRLLIASTSNMQNSKVNAIEDIYSSTTSVELAICMLYNNPIDLALNMLKYGPIINMDTTTLSNIPKKSIPPPRVASIKNPDIPNTANIDPTIAVTTDEMTTVMTINPK